MFNIITQHDIVFAIHACPLSEIMVCVVFEKVIRALKEMSLLLLNTVSGSCYYVYLLAEYGGILISISCNYENTSITTITLNILSM